jgi:hypothetical protein
MENAGHPYDDILTAFILEQQTGIQMERWLDARKQGKAWPDAVESLAKGKSLEARPLSSSSRRLSRSEMDSLIKEGYSGSDILAAGDLVYQYGSDAHAVLNRHKVGESWESIRQTEIVRLRAEMEAQEKAQPNFGLGPDGKDTATASGLTKGEISALMNRGYSLEEVLRADAFAYALGLSIRDVVSSKRLDQDLMDAVREAKARQPESTSKQGGGW